MIRFLFLAALSSFLMITATPGQEPEGWIRIFDGQTLEGWKASENPSSWTVVDGAIQGSGPRSHLYYMGGPYRDFEFKAEVMTQPGANSGIYFHTRYQEGGWPETGYESQVNNTQRDPVKTGSLYGVVKLYESAARDNEWWTQQIIVRGKNIVVKIDGKLVIDYTEPPGVTGGRRLSEGTLALQQHDPDSVVFYRNIMVKPLSPDSQ